MTELLDKCTRALIIVKKMELTLNIEKDELASVVVISYYATGNISVAENLFVQCKSMFASYRESLLSLDLRERL